MIGLLPFLRSFPRLHFTGQPLVELKNVGCYLRLKKIFMMKKLYLTLVELSQQSASEQFLHSWQNRDRRTPVDLAEKRKMARSSQ